MQNVIWRFHGEKLRIMLTLRLNQSSRSSCYSSWTRERGLNVRACNLLLGQDVLFILLGDGGSSGSRANMALLILFVQLSQRTRRHGSIRSTDTINCMHPLLTEVSLHPFIHSFIRSSPHPFINPQPYTRSWLIKHICVNDLGRNQTTARKYSSAYRARQIWAEVTFRRTPWQRGTAGWENSSLNPTEPSHCSAKWLNRTKPSTKPSLLRRCSRLLWSLPELLRATDCCSRSYPVRLLRRQFTLEKSGCQAPPRKQKAKGSVGVQQGSTDEKQDRRKHT